MSGPPAAEKSDVLRLCYSTFEADIRSSQKKKAPPKGRGFFLGVPTQDTKHTNRELVVARGSRHRDRMDLHCLNGNLVRRIDL